MSTENDVIDVKHGTKSVQNELSLEFLVILKDHDFGTRKCFQMFNLHERTKLATKNLPGIVHICKMEETKQFKIKGMKLPYVLYMKLPKENIFVSSDSWASEYFNSQTFELITIFTALGASEVKFKTSRDHNEANATSVHTNANLNAVNIPIKVGAEVEHFEDGDDSNTFDGQIKIKQPVSTKYSSLEEFIEKQNLYYIKNNHEWQSLIGYKLSNDTVTKLKFNTTLYKGFKCGTNVTADLEALGISVSLFDSGSKYVKTIFEVHFVDERDGTSRDESSGGSMSIHI